MSFSNVLIVWADFCTGWGNRRLEMWCYFSLLTFYYSYFLSRSSTAGLFVIIKVFPMCSPWFMLKQHVIVLWKWSCSYHFQNSWLPPTLNFVPRSRAHTFIQDHEEKTCCGSAKSSAAGEISPSWWCPESSSSSQLRSRCLRSLACNDSASFFFKPVSSPPL